jgi:serine/threonine-protein kinase ATR
MMGVVALGVQRAIANIEARLRGVVVGVGAAPSLPLSVEGQAHRLISEAVSHTNLAKMYIWWMAWF